jgi:toxin ParE1/3/4
MEIIWRPSAIEDAEGASAFIGRNNPEAARRVYLAIEEATAGLSDFPERGRPGRVEGTREIVVTHTPYLIAYIVDDDLVTILAILHHARRWPEVL